MLFDSLMIASRCESFQQMSLDYNILEKPFVLVKIWEFLKNKADKKTAAFEG